MQRVLVVPHNPEWMEEFARESLLVASALGNLMVEIHHIGSTAILNIHAKPVIDMLASVMTIEAVDARRKEFECLGYEVMGEFGIPGRRYFRKDNRNGDRTHQIHIFQSGSPQIGRHLAFRDFMKAHPHFAHQYDALKQRLAAMYPNDIDSYAKGKDSFINEMDAQAATWEANRSHQDCQKPVESY